MKSISIPGFEEAFAEILSGRRWTCPNCNETNKAETDSCQKCGAAATEAPSAGASVTAHCASTVRQRMLSKFIVDAFALRSVDLAMILKIANLISSPPADEPVVVVMSAGADHTDSVT